MTKLAAEISGLSDKQRAILEMRLMKRRGYFSPTRIIAQPRGSCALPLSFAQQRLWFLDQLNPGSVMYNVPAALRLKGRLESGALERTLSEIVRRHEILRTTYEAVEGDPVLVIHSPEPITLPLLDISQMAEVEREAQGLRLAQAEMLRAFNLAQGPLLRVTVVKLGAEDHLMLFTLHHMVSDGWAVGILINEVAVLYEAYAMGRPSPLPELSIQYADYAYWQLHWLQGERLQTQLAYWRKELAAPLPRLALTTDYPRPPMQTYRGAAQILPFPKRVLTEIKSFCASEGVTLFMMLLAVFKVLLYAHTDQDDILVGTPIANRDDIECEGLIGCFLNTLVLRTSLSGNPGFRELLNRVCDKVLSAHAHQHLPFEKLVDEIQPERNLNENPLFQVSFTLENVAPQPPKLKDLSVNFVEIESPTVQFDLVMHMVESEQELVAALQYSTDLFKATTIRRLLRHYEVLLQQVLAEPDVRLNDLKARLAETDRQQQYAKEKQVQEAGFEKLKRARRKLVGELQPERV